jgi:UDP:flavonoid glycosyltransferase YjiC (YdhE family)
MRFAAAPEYQLLPTRERPLKPYQAAVRAAEETMPLLREADPDAVVVDILTVAASLAAERDGRRWVTLVPHLLPTPEPGFPPYSVGARLPRTPLGAAGWRALRPLLRRGEEQGRRELNGARARLGLAPLDYAHGGISRRMALVATLPQLEYPRRPWPPWARVTGPLLWEQPFEDVAPPPGSEPLVVVAPSTSQDPDQHMLRAALEGLADEPVRVLATINRRPPPGPIAVPPNARVVDWISYARSFPAADAVICHTGHGTVARALASGAPIVGCPAAGDQAENAARLAWAGAGVSLPRRLITPRGVRLALRKLLADPGYAARAAELARWVGENDGAGTAASLVEQLGAA